MALTLAGGTAIGTALSAATIKAIGAQRVQLDITGTYVTGGHAGLAAFVQSVLGTRVTIIDVIDVKPGGAFRLVADLTNDKLMVYVASTGVEVAGGAGVTVTNGEVLVLFQ